MTSTELDAVAILIRAAVDYANAHAAATSLRSTQTRNVLDARVAEENALRHYNEAERALLRLCADTKFWKQS